MCPWLQSSGGTHVQLTVRLRSWCWRSERQRGKRAATAAAFRSPPWSPYNWSPKPPRRVRTRCRCGERRHCSLECRARRTPRGATPRTRSATPGCWCPACGRRRSLTLGRAEIASISAPGLHRALWESRSSLRWLVAALSPVQCLCCLLSPPPPSPPLSRTRHGWQA